MGSQLATSLTGYSYVDNHVSMFPYVRGHFDRDFLYRLWTLIEAENDWPAIMWDYKESDTPISQHGDLVEWIHYMESPFDPKALMLVQDNDTKRICGLIWFNKIKADSAHGSIWMSREARGQPHVREAVNLGLEYAFYARGWKAVYALTPWAVAKNLLRRCAFTEVAVIPDVFGPKVYLMAIKESDYGQRRRVDTRFSN